MDITPFLDTSCRLFIKCLPAQFSPEDTISFLQAFGAIHVDVMSQFGKMKRSAFANFINRTEAKLAMSRLHQLEVLGARLIVLWATPKLEKLSNVIVNCPDIPVATPVDTISDLTYKYPKINPGTLNNISDSIATNEEFYTNVLHVMNRMKLPTPFVSEETHSFVAMTSPSDTEPDLEPLRAKHAPLPHGPICVQGILSKRADQSDEREIGVKKKKIEIKLSSNSETANLSELYTSFDTPLPFGTLQKQNTAPAIREEHAIESRTYLGPFMTDSELRRDRLSSSEMRTNPLFRHYTPGTPSSRLYIKNLARATTHRDLEYLYGRYVDFSNQQECLCYVISLMKTGRMRGQAFVGLSSPEIAVRAVEETNGFVLNGRPMVVVFARSVQSAD